MRFAPVAVAFAAMWLGAPSIAAPASGGMTPPPHETSESAPAGHGTRQPWGMSRPSVNTSEPLTDSECTKLGGTVSSTGPAVVCNSGKVCITVDQNKQEHLVCVSKQ
jgi:hypothetical protein